MERICGFMVVRLPRWNFDAASRGAYTAVAPMVGTIYYGGVDRMAWFDVDEALYAGTLSAELASLRKSTKAPDFTGLDVTHDLKTALELLEFSNRQQGRNCLIAMHSERLEDVKGGQDMPTSQLRWIGYDVVSHGGLSLLREGLFATPERFPTFADRLAVTGLFEESSVGSEYAAMYLSLTREGLAEEIRDGSDGVDMVAIAEVVMP